MQPEAGGRRCEACSLVVHDLSALTEREAVRLLRGRAGERTCVRVRVRADGRAAFRGEPPRALPAAAALALAACTPHSPEPGRLQPAVEAVQEDRLPTVVIPDGPERVARVDPEPSKPRPKKKKPEPEVEIRHTLGVMVDWE